MSSQEIAPAANPGPKAPVASALASAAIHRFLPVRWYCWERWLWLLVLLAGMPAIGGLIWREIHTFTWHWRRIDASWSESDIRRRLGPPDEIIPTRAPDAERSWLEWWANPFSLASQVWVYERGDDARQPRRYLLNFFGDRVISKSIEVLELDPEVTFPRTDTGQ